jgi:hypothetical protein
MVTVTVLYVGMRFWALGLMGMLGVSKTVPAFPFPLGKFPMLLLRYVGLLLFPWPLYAYRLIPTIHPLLAFGGMAVLLSAMFFDTPWVRFCITWFIAALIPKIPLLATGYYMLDHWAYPALPAVLLPIGLGLTRGWLSNEIHWRRTATAVFGILLCLCIFSDQFHTIVRGTDEKNYRWSLRFTRATPILFNLGLICLRTRREAEAITYLEPVHALYPEDPNITRALIDAYLQGGRPEEGRRLLKMARRSN